MVTPLNLTVTFLGFGVAIGAPVIGWVAGQTTIGFGLIISGIAAILALIVVQIRS